MRNTHKNDGTEKRVFLNCDECIGLTPHRLEDSGRMVCEYCRHPAESTTGMMSLHRKRGGLAVYRVH